MGASLIKGSTFKLRLQFVKERWGVKGLDRVLKTLPPADAETIQKTLPIGWYPLSLNALLDQAICHELARSDERIYEEMGAFSAEHFAQDIYSQYFQDKTPDGFLRLTCELYNRYYRNVGARRNEIVGPGHVEMFVEGSPEAYRPNCRSNVGFMRRGMELCGAKSVLVEEIACASGPRPTKGLCQARVTWRP